MPLADRRPRLVLAALLLAVPVAGSAQRTAPYSSLTLRLTASDPVSIGRLQEYWRAGTGAGVELHTPFHRGTLGVTLHTHRFTPAAETQPAFRGYLLGVDWRFGVPSPAFLRPSISVMAGDFLTTFDGVETKGLAKESEIFLGGSASVAIPLRGRTALVLSASGAQVLTSTPVRIGIVSAGLGHTIVTPGWLRAAIE